MQLSNKQKLYGGVLGLCTVAFLLDRAVMGPGEVAAAESSAALTVASTTSSDPVAMAATQSVASSPGEYWALAAHLEQVAWDQQIDMTAVPDAFRPGDSWFPEPVPDAVPDIPAGPQPAEVFLAKHTLQAVMAGSRGVAVIDGRAVRIGETIDGFTLVSVGDRSVALENSRGQRVELELEDERRRGDEA